VRVWLPLLLTGALLTGAGCRSGGTAGQELAQLRARVSTLEAENAHLQGQVSLTEAERDQLQSQVNTLTTEVAKAQGGGGGTPAEAVAGTNLVVMPKEVHPGEWIAVYVRNYPLRLLPQAGVALRTAAAETNLTHVGKLNQANIFLLPVPPALAPGPYRVVIGEAGALGPGAKLDDQVAITIRSR
jgi:outer membrane murein-binding lipoprotein Lpp